MNFDSEKNTEEGLSELRNYINTKANCNARIVLGGKTKNFKGTMPGIIEETLFENRFDFLKEIKKMDGKYFVFENKAIIIPSVLKPANLKCKDLRGAAALLLACMACNGTTTLENIEYLSRGYEDIVKVLSSVGVDIKEKLIYEA